MKYMLAALMALLTIGATQAQERSATTDMDSQMTWSQLKSAIDSINTNTAAVDKRVDQIVVCGKKKMVYAPGATGVDSDGCLAGSGGSGNVQIGRITNTLYSNVTVPVVFAKAYTSTPQVVASVDDYYYWGGCSANSFSTLAKVTSVTTAGFNIVLAGSSDGCNKKQSRAVTWVATGQ